MTTAQLAVLGLLDAAGLAFMMGWLESRLERGEPLRDADWREAYGAAADDQTVRQLVAGMGAGL